MAEDTPKGETVTPAAPKTDAKPTVTPTPPAPADPVKTEETNAVEELRKELEQSKMRANQLANQLKSKEEAEAKAKEAELEEQNQFKELHEQEKAKREALEAELADKEKAAELNEAKDKVLADYSDEVKSLAEEVGLDLSDTDEASVTTFKEKMDKLNTRVINSGSVGANNPSLVDTKFELSGDDLRQALEDPERFHEIVTKKFPVIASMTDPRNRK